jgi:hypothetical protein
VLWSGSSGNYEIAAALAMGPVSAGNLASLAWTLGTRLPGIGRLLAAGTLTKPKAKLIVRTFDPLDEDEATRAEALIARELDGKTWFQVERLARRAALAVAPDIAERRRSEAERKRARVTMLREESGAAGLSGRDLPTAQALSGHANILARAREYEASGAFPEHNTSSLQALAYLHLLNNITAKDAIAFARTAIAPSPDRTTPGRDDEDARGQADGDHSHRPTTGGSPHAQVKQPAKPRTTRGYSPWPAAGNWPCGSTLCPPTPATTAIRSAPTSQANGSAASSRSAITSARSHHAPGPPTNPTSSTPSPTTAAAGRMPAMRAPAAAAAIR